MGNVTAKTSGDIARFMSPSMTNIKSLKVHFSPKQLGTGDPSPENVREIEGWGGVEVNGSGKNIAHIVGYSASTVNVTQTRQISNKYGTTLSTVDFTLPDTKLIVTQSQFPNTDTKHSYQNGYFQIIIDNLVFNKKYNISFKIDNITNNPLNATLKSIFLGRLSGSQTNPSAVDGNRLIFKNILYSQQTGYPLRQYLEIRNCGMSFTLSEFMVTPVDEDDFEYEPYQGNNISYQWRLPDEYQEVEYIESTGTQWIDTGVIFNHGIKITAQMGFVEKVNSKTLFGVRLDTGATRFLVTYYQGLDFAYWSDYEPFQPDVDILYNITFDSSKPLKYICGVDNQTWERGINQELISDITGYIFAYHRKSDNSPQGMSKSYFKSMKIENSNGEKLFDAIPCYRKSDGEIGIYDTVSKQFLTNQGTGSFLKGEDVDKTFYGGYVDLISGELVGTHSIITFDGSDDELITHSSNFNDWVQLSGIPNMKKGSFFSDDSSVSNRAKKVSSSSSKNELQILIGANNTKTYVYNIARLDSTVTTDETLRNWFLNNPITFTYPLETPITHQLTPTQLKSFVGQNNFWSNADYVEIEYDLIETEDIQKCRKKIILNQPQLKTISDKIVSFNTDMVAPLKNCKIYFKPIQLGSGDPSPTNVRNINGWTSIDSYVNGDKISIDWASDAGTVYGGYLDLAKGEVVANMTVVEFDGSSDENWQVETLSSGLTNYYMYATSLIPKARGNQRTDGYICSNMCIPRGVDETYTSGMFYFSNSGALNVYLGGKSNTTTVAEFKSWLTEHKLQIAYWLETPIHYPLSSLTSQQLLTIKSTNHIWSETNGQQIDVKYWTHKNLTPTPLTDYLENQTWTDSAYISSSGKKTTGGTSASHFLTNQILLEAGTYVLSGFSYYVGTDNTNFRIHAYDSTGKWLRQIAYKQIGNLSPVDISFTLDTDTYVNVSIAMDFDGVLAKIN